MTNNFTRNICNCGNKRKLNNEYTRRMFIYMVKQSHTTSMDAQWEGMNSSYSFSTSALDKVSGQRHARPRFTPRERTPGTHWTGGWVGPRAGMDTETRGKILVIAGDRTSIARSSSTYC
jgi:hypothetical protein